MRQVKIISIFLVLAFSYAKGFTQLCNGSLGDPVVNITFGSGDGSGTSLNSLTNYNYITNDCPNDGSYTIRNSTSNCFNSTWFTVFEDHTPGDANGNMMVVNASYTPGDFFVTTVDGLCPNTTYEFAAWIMNVLKPTACNSSGIKPNVTFSIETTSGTVLQSYKTGDIPSTIAQWKQYGFFFSTTTGNSVVIRMTNNAPGGCGNDLLLDDITFRPCGALVTASISGAPDAVDVCEADNTVFTLNANVSSGYNDPVFQWQLSTNNGASWANIPGAINTNYVRAPVITPGTYLYRFAVAERNNINISSCLIMSNVVKINVNGLPQVNASSKGECSGDTLSLTAEGGISYLWTGPGNFTSNQQSSFIIPATPANNGTYYVKVTSAQGCDNTDSTTIKISSRPVVDAGIDAEICEGKTTPLNGTISNTTSFHWEPGPAISNINILNPVVSPKQTTVYILTGTNDKCRSSDSVMIIVNNNPRADAGPDKVMIAGQSVLLNGVAGGSNITYSWSPVNYMADQAMLTPSVSPPANQVYTLLVSSNKGCGTAADDVLVKVYKELFVPNAFTPNGDGINDTWRIETLDVFPNADVKVYNRYGEKVFDNYGVNTPWNGKYRRMQLPPGAYVYTIDLKNSLPIIKGVVFIVL